MGEDTAAPGSGPPAIRPARPDDVPAIVELLADDALGRGRERPGDPVYDAAFAAVDADPNQLLVVADDDGEVVGTLQLSVLAGLSRQGATRAQVEGVRVRSDRRGSGTGRALVEWAVATARQHGASVIQLTSDASRDRAHAFYESLGFRATHVGLKREL